MKIHDFSIKTDLSIDTLRYYDRIGLLSPKRNNNIRNYCEADLETAEIIKKLKKLNFSISDMINILEIDKEFKNESIVNENDKKRLTALINIFEEKYNQVLEQYDFILLMKNQMEKILYKAKLLLKSETIISNDKDKEF